MMPRSRAPVLTLIAAAFVANCGFWAFLVCGPRPRSSSSAGRQTIVALQARQQDGLSEEWIDIKGSKAKFGAKTPFQVALAGAPDLAASWLYGDEPGDNSVDRLVQAGKPAFSKIERAKELEEPNSPMQVYKFSLPALDLMGLGRATSSINLFGAIRGAEDKYLEIGTFGNPQANIRFATGMDLALPVFSLNVTGELRIMKDGFSEKRSSATGWVAIEVQGEVPSLAGITLPEEVLRGAAREACRQTCAYASRKLEQELSEDFARWRAEKVRRERRRVTA
ncbi:unnamed protein product [Durusdinium trenchii]|uniref:Uncharacterized protein n=2 Tax=Durusdinium trenchii TaxID=1381693 RepID=A0ABP0RYV0_9DINO